MNESILGSEVEKFEDYMTKDKLKSIKKDIFSEKTQETLPDYSKLNIQESQKKIEDFTQEFKYCITYLSETKNFGNILDSHKMEKNMNLYIKKLCFIAQNIISLQSNILLKQSKDSNITHTQIIKMKKETESFLNLISKVSLNKNNNLPTGIRLSYNLDLLRGFSSDVGDLIGYDFEVKGFVDEFQLKERRHDGYITQGFKYESAKLRDGSTLVDNIQDYAKIEELYNLEKMKEIDFDDTKYEKQLLKQIKESDKRTKKDINIIRQKFDFEKSSHKPQIDIIDTGLEKGPALVIFQETHNMPTLQGQIADIIVDTKDYYNCLLTEGGNKEVSGDLSGMGTVQAEAKLKESISTYGIDEPQDKVFKTKDQISKFGNFNQYAIDYRNELWLDNMTQNILSDHKKYPNRGKNIIALSCGSNHTPGIVKNAGKYGFKKVYVVSCSEYLNTGK